MTMRNLQERPSTAGGKRRILIVEDEKSIARFIAGLLQSDGYSVILAETGKEALFMAESHMPDLMILDSIL